MRAFALGLYSAALAAMSLDRVHAAAMEAPIFLPVAPSGGVRNYNKPSTNRYRPHQGKQECDRRIRQMAKSHASRREQVQ